VAKKLENATVTCLPYQQTFKFAKSKTLVFIDPPYIDAGKKCYKHSFTEDDHRDLAQRLHEAQFNWVLTYDSHNLVPELYSDFSIFDLEFNYFMSSAYRAGQQMKMGRELLVTNIV
jgi:site-specific DNA-adenine methylase